LGKNVDFNYILEKNKTNKLVRFERVGSLSIEDIPNGDQFSTYLGTDTDSTEVDYIMNKFLDWLKGNFIAENS
jgi:hypothetical protein